MNRLVRRVGACIAAGPISVGASAAEPRARDLGVPFEGRPRPQNAITDVRGVEVGHSTIVSGTAGGKEPVVRTGVTAVLPRGKRSPAEFFAATVQATEEAIINALVAARTTEGFVGHRANELPHDRLRAVLRKYNRLGP